MSRIGWDAWCPDCGGDLATINPGSTVGHRAHAVLGCVDCGTEIHVRVDYAVVRARKPGGRFRSPELIDQLAAEAHRIVCSGHSILHACRTVGIDRHSYYDRYGPGRKRAAA